jgi:predicted enzyme related to lactoylglutathione lyase
MKQMLVWFDIPALDLDRAIKFYSAVHGAEVKKETFGDVTLGMLPHEEGVISGCLVAHVEDFKPSTDGIMVYFNCNGRLRAAVDAVRATGGTVQRDIHPIGPYGFRAEVLDSEGNCIALHSEKDD